MCRCNRIWGIVFSLQDVASKRILYMNSVKVRCNTVLHTSSPMFVYFTVDLVVLHHGLVTDVK
jgi:hypothetical protein